jgi:hypothetical protein
VLDADVLGAKNYSYYVEPEGVARTLKARHPDFCGPAELALLPPAHGSYRTAERVGSAGLHFDERDRSLNPTLNFACRDEVDVAAAILESPLRYLPTVYAKPPFRNPLTFQSKCLACC